jgi:hypothetical protein
MPTPRPQRGRQRGRCSALCSYGEPLMMQAFALPQVVLVAVVLVMVLVAAAVVIVVVG